MLTERCFDAGPVRIHYVEGPVRGQPLVLLHDVTLCWQSFLPVLPFFVCRYHTYALDLRGHGRSSHPHGFYEIEEYGEDVNRFLRARVGEPAVLVGHSLGAEVALWVAAATPARARALVLEEPGLNTHADGRAQQHPIHQRLQAIHQLLMSQPSLDGLIAALQVLLPEADAVGRRVWATSLHQMNPVVLAHLLDGSTLRRIRPDELLAQVQAPVLLLQGNPALEGMLTHADAARAQALLQDCTHVYRTDLGHDWHTVAPLDFCQLVSGYVESLQPVATDVDAVQGSHGMAVS